MKLTSILAIYALFWALTLFVVLPFGVRTSEEVGEKVQLGNADSAPHRFQFGKVVLRTTIVSAILFGLFYANYVFGWVGPDVLDWMLPRA